MSAERYVEGRIECPRCDGHGWLIRPPTGAQLREMRLAAGLTQRQVAEGVQVGTPYISRIEHDRERPSADLLARILDIVDVQMVPRG